jgi:hypothetical protein
MAIVKWICPHLPGAGIEEAERSSALHRAVPWAGVIGPLGLMIAAHDVGADRGPPLRRARKLATPRYHFLPVGIWKETSDIILQS